MPSLQSVSALGLLTMIGDAIYFSAKRIQQAASLACAERAEPGVPEGFWAGIFYSLREAQIVIEKLATPLQWARPHGSLRYHAPAPEVTVPCFAVWPVAQPESVPPATLRLQRRPIMN